MTSRLIEFILFPCLIIALLLAMAGVQQVQFGDDYYNFLRAVSRDFENWSVSIPSIPKIPSINSAAYDDSGLILTVLIKIANAFFTLVNVMITGLNVLITVTNVIIQLIQFCLTIIYRLISFRDSLAGVVLT